MQDEKLYDIAEVCRMLKTTSRTLRFYEERGIIESTSVGNSTRRRYTEEQLSHIRNVLVLRTLGLSIRSISELQTKNADLKDAVLSKRAEIYASIDTRIREIHLLNEAITAMDSGKDVFSMDFQDSQETKAEEIHIAETCMSAILRGDTETLYRYLSPRLTQYMPEDVYRAVRKDTLSPLGEFVSHDRTTADETYPNKIYGFVKFSKSGLKITFVFYGGKIDGLWMGYYDPNTR